jgi:hypothetical protein
MVLGPWGGGNYERIECVKLTHRIRINSREWPPTDSPHSWKQRVKLCFALSANCREPNELNFKSLTLQRECVCPILFSSLLFSSLFFQSAKLSKITSAVLLNESHVLCVCVCVFVFELESERRDKWNESICLIFLSSEGESFWKNKSVTTTMKENRIGIDCAKFVKVWDSPLVCVLPQIWVAPHFPHSTRFILSHSLNHTRTKHKTHHNTLTMTAQNLWRWCRNCQGLHWRGQSAGFCVLGGGHDATGSGDYTLWWGGSTFLLFFFSFRFPSSSLFAFLLPFYCVLVCHSNRSERDFWASVVLAFQ